MRGVGLKARPLTVVAALIVAAMSPAAVLGSDLPTRSNVMVADSVTSSARSTASASSSTSSGSAGSCSAEASATAEARVGDVHKSDSDRKKVYGDNGACSAKAGASAAVRSGSDPTTGRTGEDQPPQD